MNANNPAIRDMIARYKAHIQTHGLTDELYKWELIGKFRGRPNPDAPDLLAEISAVNFGNLLYQMAKSVMKDLAFKRTEPYRACMRALMVKDTPIDERISDFFKDTLALYREIVPEEKYGHHQDERTAGVLLAYHNPDRYAIYKDSFYKKYCKLLGIAHKWKGEKYGHYQVLVQELVQDYIAQDAELLEMMAAQLPATVYQDPNHLLLAQNILYIVLDQGVEVDDEEGTGYWLFQGDPKVFDIRRAVRDGNLKHWSVKAHKKAMAAGDKVILYLTGEHAGCYALAELTTTVQTRHRKDDADQNYWIQPQPQEDYEAIGIAITHDWLDAPILTTHIQANPALAKLNAGHRGTNFVATKAEYDALLEMKSTPDSAQNPMKTFPLNQILYGPPGTGKTYHTVNRALEILGITTTDRAAMKRIFEEKVNAGQIAFVTFHQSMSYEDFVEGIKPHLKEDGGDEGLMYQVQPGIFKSISEKADQRKGNFSEVIERLKLEISEADNKPPLTVKTQSSTFDVKFRGGNMFYVQPHNSTKENAWNPASIPMIEKYFESGSTEGLYNVTYVKGIVDHMSRSRGLVKAKGDSEALPHILIIDEINRGNVSQIFGELITLIEEDKRAGKPEALSVTLPYSKESFSVPPNLYIIGTMNTADRSVEALDTALRRRFEFVEMAPQPDLLRIDPADLDSPLLRVSDIALRDLLYTINLRIEKLLDRDHQIGHAFFMGITTWEQLKNAFQHKLMPLMQEYFFGDYSKIGLVLGKGFVHKLKGYQKADEIFADFKTGYESDLAQREVWHLHNIAAMDELTFLAALAELKVFPFSAP